MRASRDNRERTENLAVLLCGGCPLQRQSARYFMLAEVVSVGDTSQATDPRIVHWVHGLQRPLTEARALPLPSNPQANHWPFRIDVSSSSSSGRAAHRSSSPALGPLAPGVAPRCAHRPAPPARSRTPPPGRTE